MELRFRVRNRRFVPVARAERARAALPPVAWDYASLRARGPPNALLQRSLVVEGDTERAAG